MGEWQRGSPCWILRRNGADRSVVERVLLRGLREVGLTGRGGVNLGRGESERRYGEPTLPKASPEVGPDLLGEPSLDTKLDQLVDIEFRDLGQRTQPSIL